MDAFHGRILMCRRVRRRLILTNPEGIKFTYALRFQFAASNNEAGYEALIAGLQIAARMGVKDVHCREAKTKKADALSKIASTSFAHLSKHVLVEILKDKSIKEKEVGTVIEEDGPTWMTPIVDYLNEGTLLGDKKEARKLRLKARQYELMEGTLYRRSFLTPWLRCVGPLQAEYVMREIHEGSCSMHAGPRTKESQIFDSFHGLLYEVDKGGGDNHMWIVIPTEIGMPTYRTAAVDVVGNDKELRLNLDLLEEWRERDFVYQSNDASHAIAGGKLGPKWEGPYEVIEALGDGAYKQRSRDGTILPRTRNIANLKRCYL
uniref:Reverse transcriptase domain-containing protein n=1 Tax=Tanacetum cinerariifolium TaxID=118510 RepID=A0A6L2JTU7_TANCI|nr:reverse transcriptase domain-containing protein [Tanacetum cinerariifolium]